MENAVFDTDVAMPVALLRRSALDRNRAWMRAIAAFGRVSLCPHAKTTMSPELCAEQMEDGAWGLTAATVAQAQRLHAWGAKRILLGNQVIDHGAVRALARLAEAPDLDLYVLVDSPAGCDRLAGAADPRRPIQLLLEVGAEGGRTGVRGVEAAIHLARHVASSPGVALRGIEAFEYVFAGDSAAMAAGVERLLSQMGVVAREVARVGAFAPGEILLSAGGSAFYDRVIALLSPVASALRARIVLRAGCVVSHDHGMVQRGYAGIRRRAPDLAASGPSPEPALEVWSVVQSMPEPGLALLSAGKRDLSFDIDLPTPVKWRRAGQPDALPPGHRIARLNDHHAYLTVPAESPLRIGDLVGLGISHPCTIFDRWRSLPVVDDSYRLVGTVRTYFREED